MRYKNLMCQQLLGNSNSNLKNLLLLDATTGSCSIHILSSIVGHHFAQSLLQQNQPSTITWLGCNESLTGGEKEVSSSVRKVVESELFSSANYSSKLLPSKQHSLVQFVNVAALLAANMLSLSPSESFSPANFAKTLVQSAANTDIVVIDDFVSLCEMVGIKHAYVVVQCLKVNDATSNSKLVLRTQNPESFTHNVIDENSSNKSSFYSNVAGVEAGSDACPWLGAGGVVAPVDSTLSLSASSGFLSLPDVTRLLVGTVDCVMFARVLASGLARSVDGSVDFWENGKAFFMKPVRVNFKVRSSGVECILVR